MQQIAVTKQKMRTCIDCDKDISDLHPNAIRCKKCQKEYRKKYKIENRRKNETIKHFPKSARATKETYALVKMCSDLKYEELSQLLNKYRERLNCTNTHEEFLEMRRYLKIINDIRNKEFGDTVDEEAKAEYLKKLYRSAEKEVLGERKGILDYCDEKDYEKDRKGMEKLRKGILEEAESEETDYYDDQNDW